MRTVTRSLFLIPAAMAALAIPVSAAKDGGFERVLEVGSSVDLHVETDSGRITVQPGPPNTVKVVAVMKIQNQWLNLGGEEKIARLERNPPIEQSGDKIRIGRMLNPGDHKGISISYEITVPQATRLVSRSDSGGQTISGIDGPVNAEADSGGLRFADIGGDITASCDSGRIVAEAIDGTFRAQADSGGIEAMGVRGEVDVSTDSGGIRIEQVAAADVRASADSGGIRVTVPEGAGYDVTAHSDSGGVEVRAPITVSGTIKRNRVEGRIGNGGHRLELSVDSGGIRISQGGGEL